MVVNNKIASIAAKSSPDGHFGTRSKCNAQPNLIETRSGAILDMEVAHV
jgi:hypothetical protein